MKYMKRSLAAALAFLASLTVGLVASADAPAVRLDAVAPINYIGASLDPSNPTTSSSVFDLGSGGRITGVTVSTRNEMVLAAVSSLNCSGEACPVVTPFLAKGLPVVSLHDSVAYLKVKGPIKQVQYSAVTPSGLVSLSAEVLEGDLSGPLAGHAVIGSAFTAQTTANITGKGTYACFAPLPGPLAPCIAGLGTLAPIFLDVADFGRLDGVIADGNVTWQVVGDLEVQAVLKIDLTKLYTGRTDAVEFGGAIYLKNATATAQ
jgi:hypothetical protein